ncbi:juvenile hormone esterase-like [Anoplophora glabripennis]|uniref:juvenile hormone esterase-like n=1 Tax=Anoplophora glabripennis TaxID=217634 RepID=UPI0008745758|nr:juvenile hormone esterase-like [Anoplophora glabripennis]
MMKCNGLLILILCAIRSTVADVDDPTLVTLPDGQIRGQTLQSPNGNAFYAFQEIPYAAPPVGELRFQAPVAPAKWEGILNTTINEKICYQSGAVHVPLPGLNQTEDCLYLNVYTPLTPGDTSQTPLPVLIWIYGGGFGSGAGAIQIYNPGFFIDQSIVVVTINYRIGVLGFLTTEDGVIPGNLGLKDQHCAIQWVKNNIDLFGGDPEKITISGESAGAGSVGLHLLSQRNEGLFRGAILQSGTALSQWAHQNYARFYAFELARSLDSNFTSDNSTELLELLQSLSASDINNNTITAAVGKETQLMQGQGIIWVPVIEDASLDGALITGLFHEDIRTGNINQVPIIIGFNSEEALFFLKSDPSKVERRAKYFDSDLSNLIRNKFNMTTENKLTAGTKLRQVYTNGTFEDDPGQVVKFYSDESFITASIRHAKLQSNYTDVYMYQFSYKGNMGGMKDLEIAGIRGVGHSEELCYLWDAHLSFGFSYGSPYRADDPEDVTTRQRLLILWSNFVKYLNPTPEVDSSLGNVTWEKVSPNNLVYLNINDTLEMQTNPRNYLKCEEIIDEYAIPPLINY